MVSEEGIAHADANRRFAARAWVILWRTASSAARSGEPNFHQLEPDRTFPVTTRQVAPRRRRLTLYPGLRRGHVNGDVPHATLDRVWENGRRHVPGTRVRPYTSAPSSVQRSGNSHPSERIAVSRYAAFSGSSPYAMFSSTRHRP